MTHMLVVERFVVEIMCNGPVIERVERPCEATVVDVRHEDTAAQPYPIGKWMATHDQGTDSTLELDFGITIACMEKKWSCELYVYTWDDVAKYQFEQVCIL